jgi:hypothetical protein
VHLEASIKPPIHNLIHEFLINMVFTMACPNFQKRLENGLWFLKGVVPLYLAVSHTRFEHIGYP